MNKYYFHLSTFVVPQFNFLNHTYTVYYLVYYTCLEVIVASPDIGCLHTVRGAMYWGVYDPVTLYLLAARARHLSCR